MMQAMKPNIEKLAVVHRCMSLALGAGDDDPREHEARNSLKNR